MGFFLGDGDEEILLPTRYVPKDAIVGDKLKVFVYLDNENRPIATTLIPYAVVGDFEFLIVKEVNEHGAFMDWGLAKDIFVPYSEQRNDMVIGKAYLVHVFIDERSGRIAATEKWEEFTEDINADLKQGESVQLLVARKTDMGYKAIINNRYEGLIYENEIFEPLNEGDKKTGYIKQIRDDGKVDLTLQKQGYSHIIDTKDLLLQHLKTNNGFLPLGDKSTPEDIYRELKISKKVFKKTIGGLFKDQLITLGDFETRLAAEE